MKIITGTREGFAGHPNVVPSLDIARSSWRKFWFARAPSGLCVRVFEDGLHAIIRGVDDSGAYTGSNGAAWKTVGDFPATEEGRALAEAFVKYKIGLST